jgi:lysophospholipase L1-like esterase
MSNSSNTPAIPAPKRPRWKRLLQNLALSGGTFLLCIAVCEVILRMNGYGNLEIYQPDPALYWKLKPNQDCFTKVDRKPVHINWHGTRGPDFSDAKPTNTLRVLSLGDSRTFGWGLTEAETYSGLLREKLQKQLGPAKTVEVINAGVNAWSYPQMLVYFRDTALRYHPDIVILAEANQWTQFSEHSSPDFVKKFMLRVRLKNLLRRFALYHYVVEIKLKDFYERNRTKFIPVDPKQDAMFKEQQQKDPDALFRSAIEDLCRLAQKEGVKPVLLFLPTVDELAATNPPAVLRTKLELGRQLSVPCVDITAAVQPGGKSLYLEGDPVHLNVQGNQIIAEKLFETVSPLVAP